MILMNKLEIAIYRYLGVMGSCFTSFQAYIWLMLALVGAICKYLGCGSTGSKRTFKYCFYMMYYYEPKNITSNFTRVNYVTPTYFNVIMWIDVLLCVLNLTISIFAARAFIKWTKPKEIRKMAYIWIRCILVISACEFITFIIFAIDFSAINKNEDIKCLLQINLTFLQSSYMGERIPAPYLLQLKSNLKTFRKKIRNYNRNLKFLNAIFNENSPDHLKNPFIPKEVVSNHVEDIWNSMFNNSIREKVRCKSDVLPSDKIMRNFVLSKHLDLDDIDFDLLKNFDGLTHDMKYSKPIRSSNVIFGRPFNQSSSITVNDTAELELARLINEYLKDINRTESNDVIQADKNFNIILSEFEKKPRFVNDKKIKDFLNETSHLADQNGTSEHTILNFGKYIESIIAQDKKNKHESKSMNNQSMHTAITEIHKFLKKKFLEIKVYNKIKKMLKTERKPMIIKDKMEEIVKYRKNEYSDEDEYETDSEESSEKLIKESLYYYNTIYSPHKFYDEQNDPFTKNPKITIKVRKTTKKPKPVYKSDLVQELCENCAYFVLGPTIVCMVLSLKTGLIWLFNIIIAALLLYYGSKIELKTKYKYFPCLSKKE